MSFERLYSRSNVVFVAVISPITINIELFKMIKVILTLTFVYSRVQDLPKESNISPGLVIHLNPVIESVTVQDKHLKLFSVASLRVFDMNVFRVVFQVLSISENRFAYINDARSCL